MECAVNWKDYALIDTGGGEKLERWGKIIVIRPDPQAIWPRSKGADWDAADMHYHRSGSGGGSWEFLRPNVPPMWTIGYDNLRFCVRPTGFKHMGLFPEQAVNWDWMRSIIAAAKSPAPRVLNLFAYTGGASVACLAAGAHVTHIDAAKGMNRQARENIALSGFEEKPHRILTDDVLKFVLRETRRGNKYDAIIMDPPVFGRGPGGELWKLEEKLCELVMACIALLSEKPLFFLLNAYTAGFSPQVYANVLNYALAQKKANGSLPFTLSTGEIGLKAQSGSILPCGMYARARFG
jgi:23S rRNA (cytosine1962-C5)-methyltransferase